jgi:light-regulated signal transduction histidine kinase (bacteriophytochrome)
MVDSNRGHRDLQQIVLEALRDMREPLDNVTRYLRFVEARYKGRLDSEADRFIADAVNGVNNMRQVISDLQKRMENL